MNRINHVVVCLELPTIVLAAVSPIPATIVLAHVAGSALGFLTSTVAPSCVDPTLNRHFFEKSLGFSKFFGGGEVRPKVGVALLAVGAFFLPAVLTAVLTGLVAGSELSRSFGWNRSLTAKGKELLTAGVSMLRGDQVEQTRERHRLRELEQGLAELEKFFTNIFARLGKFLRSCNA